MTDSQINEEMLFAEEEHKTVQYIRNYLPQEVKDRFSEDDIYYFLDAFVEYCEQKGIMDNEDEETDIDIDDAARFMCDLARKEKQGLFEPEDVRWVVDGQLDFWEQ
jgi:hypothetical protein